MGCSYSKIPKSVERDFLFFNNFRKHSIVKMLDCILNSGCFKLRWYGKLGYNGLRNLNIPFLRWQTVSAMVVRKKAWGIQGNKRFVVHISEFFVFKLRRWNGVFFQLISYENFWGILLWSPISSWLFKTLKFVYNFLDQWNGIHNFGFRGWLVESV